MVNFLKKHWRGKIEEERADFYGCYPKRSELHDMWFIMKSVFGNVDFWKGFWLIRARYVGKTLYVLYTTLHEYLTEFKRKMYDNLVLKKRKMHVISGLPYILYLLFFLKNVLY